MTKSSEVRRGSGNVFADLELPDADAYLAKSELAARIFQVIKKRRLTQIAAAEILAISQPKVSALLNGRLDGFSTDRLLRFLNALGCDVLIRISRPKARVPGKVRVMAG